MNSRTPLSAIQSDVYRPDFMKQHYEPLKERIDQLGLCEASQSLDDLIWPLITGPELALLLAEDCFREMTPIVHGDSGPNWLRGFATSDLTLRTGHLALEGVVRTIHCSGDHLAQVLNNSLLRANRVPENECKAGTVRLRLPQGSPVLAAYDTFLGSQAYLFVAAATNEMKHRSLVRSTLAAHRPPGPDQIVTATFSLNAFEYKGTPWKSTDLPTLRAIVDELRGRGSRVLDEIARALEFGLAGA